jgi:diguanylate cyclase (GGDEF)-like protein
MNVLDPVRRRLLDPLAAALDRQIARAVGPIAFVLALMYASSVYHRSINPVLLETTAPTQLALVGGFLAIAILVRIRPMPPELANVTVVVALAFIAVETIGRGQAAAGVNLHWALIGSGAVALRPRWWALCVAAIVGPWAAAAVLGVNGWNLDSFGFSLDMVTATALGGVVFMSRRRALAGLVQARDDLERLVRIDPLTGLLNRRGVEHAASEMLAASPAGAVTILFVDVDGFKAINDRYGHAEGDRALVALASLLRTTVRTSDHVARVGGDEFVVVLGAEADPDAAAGRVRQAFAAWRAPNDRYSLRVSVGTERVPGRDLEAFWTAVDVADRRMYEAKRRAAVRGPRGDDVQPSDPAGLVTDAEREPAA